MALISGWTGIDFSQFKPDEPLKHVHTNAIQSAVEAFSTADPNKVWTPNELADWVGIGGFGPLFVGSPETVADLLQEWVEETDVDGFNLAYALTHETFIDAVELLVPELQKRGVYKTDYAPGTLREKLFGEGARLPEIHPGGGLSRPGGVAAAGEESGVCVDAFAGKPRSHRFRIAGDICGRHKNPVGAWLAREEASTSNIDVACHTAIAGKPRSHRFRIAGDICGRHKTLWERGLPAKRPAHSTLISPVTPLSRASQLPHWDGGVLQIPAQRTTARFCPWIRGKPMSVHELKRPPVADSAQWRVDVPKALEQLQHWAQVSPLQPALRHKRHGQWFVWRWIDALRDVERLADGLRQQGFTEDSRLALSGAFEPDLLLLALAARHIGAELLTLPDNLDSEELHKALWRSRPTHAFVQGRQTQQLWTNQGLTLLNFAELLGPVDPAQRLNRWNQDAQLWSEEGTQWQHGLTVLLEQWLSSGQSLAFPESPGSAARDRREVAPSGLLLSAERLQLLAAEIESRLAPPMAPGVDASATGPSPIPKKRPATLDQEPRSPPVGLPQPAFHLASPPHFRCSTRADLAR